MTATTVKIAPSLAPNQIVPEALPLVGTVTTTAPTNPENALGTILGLFTHRDAELAEQIAQYVEAGEAAEQIAECAEIPTATVEAYIKARTALLTVELPAEVVQAFKTAQGAFIAADTEARDRYK